MASYSLKKNKRQKVHVNPWPNEINERFPNFGRVQCFRECPKEPTLRAQSPKQEERMIKKQSFTPRLNGLQIDFDQYFWEWPFNRVFPTHHKLPMGLHASILQRRSPMMWMSSKPKANAANVTAFLFVTSSAPLFIIFSSHSHFAPFIHVSLSDWDSNNMRN